MQTSTNFLQDFVNAMNCKSINSFRIHAEMKNGNIGITPEYTAASIPNLIKDIEKAGHNIIKIEEIQD